MTRKTRAVVFIFTFTNWAPDPDGEAYEYFLYPTLISRIVAALLKCTKVCTVAVDDATRAHAAAALAAACARTRVE